MKIWNRKI